MAITATAKASNSELLTLPRVAIRLMVSLDYLRKHFRRVPELAALLRRAGNAQFIEAEDLGRVKELLETIGAKPAKC